MSIERHMSLQTLIMNVVLMLDVFLIALVFAIGLGLFAYSRLSGRLTYGNKEHDERATISDKLRYSKQHDIGFFDGEEEQYSEAQSRLRQVGGA
ncbi:MAG: hypothetical protein AM324_013550 [Candidatus Thorarchaeota archaeon SMTZ1-83]|nr:MAG: hypothetical protein AM324_14680 [Candidatus Thorarchaeota archaeon SMTZ1-83]